MKRFRQYRSRQGRTDKSYSESCAVLLISYLAMLLIMVAVGLSS
tara:strand:- start:2945 stop:3076 length:132 start_codon:yes stop_codon:yes gene_type:complete